jgi:alpha-glucosidase (family GH31 glycosyl hydrolase)
VHDEYPRLSAKAAFDFWNATRPGDFVFHVRSGYAGSQAFAPVVWGGDAEADFDETQGLPAQLRAGLNLGMSGVPFWGSDVTGFKCLTDAPRDKEVYFRWVEFGAVSPVMRDENACVNPLKGDQSKWTLWMDDETQTLYRAMASLHTRLAPYFRALAATAHTSGAPIMMHPMLRFPREHDAWAVEDSFFFGDALYAAPVVRRGVTMRTVWIPPGRYLEWTEGTIASGPGTTTVPAPIDRLPMFLVEGQILPMLDPSVQTLAPSTDPTIATEASVADRLDVIVALGAGGSATRTLPDGTVLTATRSAATMTGNTTTAADASALATCDACSLMDTFGQVPRIRATSALAASSDLSVGDLHLVATSTTQRHIRWDVRLLP